MSETSDERPAVLPCPVCERPTPAEVVLALRRRVEGLERVEKAARDERTAIKESHEFVHKWMDEKNEFGGLGIVPTDAYRSVLERRNAASAALDAALDAQGKEGGGG